MRDSRTKSYPLSVKCRRVSQVLGPCLKHSHNPEPTRNSKFLQDRLTPFHLHNRPSRLLNCPSRTFPYGSINLHLFSVKATNMSSESINCKVLRGSGLVRACGRGDTRAWSWWIGRLAKICLVMASDSARTYIHITKVSNTLQTSACSEKYKKSTKASRPLNWL